MLELGNKCSFNRGTLISCNNKISIGDDFLGGWYISIRDTDNHSIWHNNKEVSTIHETHIGNHVWICANVDVIKGNIPNGSIVSVKSLVNKSFEQDHVLIAGIPARVVKTGIRWEK